MFQLEQFRALYKSSKMETSLNDNFRLTQPLNGRNVYDITTVPDKEELMRMVKGSIAAIDVMANGTEPFGNGNNEASSSTTSAPASADATADASTTSAPAQNNAVFNDTASTKAVFEDKKAMNPKSVLVQSIRNATQQQVP